MTGKQRMIALSSRSWDFEDKDSGRQVVGARLTVTNGALYGPEENGKAGVQVHELPVTDPHELTRIERDLPCIVEAETELRTIKGTLGVVITRLRALQPVSVRELLDGQPQLPGTDAPSVKTPAANGLARS